MTTTVTVYGKPRCVQCDATTRHLDKRGIPYTYRELEDHPYIVELAKEAGHLQAPIVVIEGLRDGARMWSGFRHSLLEELPYIIKENKA